MLGQEDGSLPSLMLGFGKDRPIRVLQLCSSAGLYGAERWTLALVKFLPRTQVESVVSILRKNPREQPDLCEEASRFGLRTHVFEAPEKVSLGAVYQLRRFMRQNGISVLHTHGYKTDIIGLIAVQGTGVRIVTSPHGWTINAKLKLRIYEYFDRVIFPFFDLVVPVSERLYEDIRHLPWLRDKTTMVEGSVDLDEIDSAPATRPELLSWKSQGRLVVGYVGRLVEGKGLHVLLRAISRLDAGRVRLAIVGDGELRADLERYAATLGLDQVVQFYGFRSDRLAFLRGFDVCVLPSRSEGLPQCLMEAMAFGVAVMASDIPGCRALVDNRVTGMLCPVDDDRCFAEQLGVLADDSVLRDRLGQAGRKLVRENYSAEAMARRYATIYRDLLKVK